MDAVVADKQLVGLREEDVEFGCRAPAQCNYIWPRRRYKITTRAGRPANTRTANATNPRMLNEDRMFVLHNWLDCCTLFRNLSGKVCFKILIRRKRRHSSFIVFSGIEDGSHFKTQYLQYFGEKNTQHKLHGNMSRRIFR